MRKMTLFILVCFAALLLCMEAHANYRIELKSGRSIITSYYWEENGRIMFYQLGGVVGYPADQVERITDTDRPESRQEQGLEPETHPGQQVEDVFDLEEPEILDMDAEEIEQLQNELRTIHQERVIMVERYYSAMRDDLDTVMDQTRKRINELLEKQDDLREQVQDIYGDLPQWWFDITEGS